jgi:hypothetical protein
VKKISVVVLAFAFLVTSTMVAQPTAIVSCSLPYTETTGKLGGADFLIRIPNPVTDWHGGLVIYCRGYLPYQIIPSIANVLSPSNTLSSTLLSLGYAVAFSNYGEGGMCMQKAVVRTHQLTEWVVDNYDVTGKIYLVGISMGGSVALELGAKYPDLYDGVLDLCGPKDHVAAYADGLFLSSLSYPALQIELNNRGVTTYPLPNLSVYKLFGELSSADTEIECGGTPDSKPQAYERISPTYNALDVTVPTISLHGTKDGLVRYLASVAFKNAVAAAGHSDLYRLYIVTDAQHGDAALWSQVFQEPYSAFYQLVDWVEDGIPANPSI